MESKPIELQSLCPNFNLPGVDGNEHSLESYAASKILLVGFTCNHCPYVQAYEQRLNQLAREYSSKGVSFVCINANDEINYPDDSFEQMKIRAKKLDFHFDYLRDETQAVAKSFNAACTPEFYIYDQNRKLCYHGRLDDNQQNPEAVKHQYIKEALDDLLNSRPVQTTQTSAIGCGIKWKK